MPAKTLPGFKREKGGARGYVNQATGQRLSRRQYDKIAQSTAGKAPVPAQRLAKQANAQLHYNRLLSSYVARKRAEGEPINKTEARKSPELKQAIKDLKTRGKTQAAETKRREALKTMGLRTGVPDWVHVGDSGKKRKGRLRNTKRYRDKMAA